jgi:serine/threonine protein kinase
MILGTPHSFTTDYWSLGVIVYEMLTGVMPFHENSEKETCDRVVTGIFEPLQGVSKEASDFVSKLLVTEPKQRLGFNGPDEILNHPWLEGLSNSQLTPPWVPLLESEISTENFEERHKLNESAIEIPSDIEEDILLSPANRRKSADVSEAPYTTKGSDNSIETDSQASEDELFSFPAIHVAQLVKQNHDEAQKRGSWGGEIAGRPMSYSGLPNLIPPDKATSSTVLKETRHLGLAPSSSFGGRRRTKRKNSFIGVNAVDDSVLKQLRSGLP